MWDTFSRHHCHLSRLHSRNLNEEARSKIAEMEKSVALPATNADIVEKLRSAQQKAGDLSARVRDLTMKNEQLMKELAEIKAGIKE